MRQRFKVHLTYEIESDGNSHYMTATEIEESVRYKVHYLGYGANQSWRIKEDTVKTEVQRMSIDEGVKPTIVDVAMRLLK